MSVEDAAIAAMDRGWKVFPVRGKVPATPNGVHDASSAHATVHGWWGMHPNRGLAVAAGPSSGLWVLDLDGDEGRAAMRELRREHGGLPETVTARTPNGWHLYWRMPAGAEIRNSAGEVAPGVDVRGEGGYAVMPPSVRPDGGTYRWVEGRSPEDLDPEEAPAWLLERATAARTPSGPAPKVEAAIPKGQRNDTLASLAGTMRRRGMEAAEIEAALLEANRRRCDPPVEESEVRSIAESIGRYAPAEWNRDGDRENGGQSLQVHDYAELAANPELTAPPQAVIPRLAFREHTTLLSSDAKGGKTTLAAAGVAAVANGSRFLGRPVRRGRVLWIRGEGHLRMVLKYLQDFGAEPEPNRILVAESGFDPVAELEALVDLHEPDLVIIDTWTSWTAPLGLDYWKASDVAPVLKRLEAVARGGPAILLLHHNRRSDKQPRGSGHLLAAVDLLRTVEDGSHDRERKVTGRGRIPCPPFVYRLAAAGDGYELKVVDPERETEEGVLTYVEANPGCSKRSIREGVHGSREAIDNAIAALTQNGLMTVDTSGAAHRHRIAQNPHSHAAATGPPRFSHGDTADDGEYRGSGGERVSIDTLPSRHGPPEPVNDQAGTSSSFEAREEPSDRHVCTECGKPIGPTSEVCAACKYGVAENE